MLTERGALEAIQVAATVRLQTVWSVNIVDMITAPGPARNGQLLLHNIAPSCYYHSLVLLVENPRTPCCAIHVRDVRRRDQYEVTQRSDSHLDLIAEARDGG